MLLPLVPCVLTSLSRFQYTILYFLKSDFTSVKPSSRSRVYKDNKLTSLERVFGSLESATEKQSTLPPFLSR